MNYETLVVSIWLSTYSIMTTIAIIHVIISYQIIIMLLINVCGLTTMQPMTAEGVLGVKILISKLKIQKNSGGMPQIPLAWHAYACCCFAQALPYNVRSTFTLI